MDLDLRINGSATGAVAAFTETAAAAQELGGATEDLGSQWKKLEAQENAQAASLANVKAGFLAVGAAVLKFSADSVKAYADAERIQKQLERAAGDLSDAFSAQADALEASLNIDGELIKQQQTLLLQWGAAPSAIAPTIKAIEDYAAATGKDALTATTELIKGVETGGAKFKALGVQYEETGDKTKDLALLTQGLADKFGGAAGVNAASLSGRISAVDVAFGNLKESFGGVIAAMESKLGVLDKVANAMQRIARGISGQGSLVESLQALTPAGIVTSLLTSQGDAAAAPDIVDPQVGSLGPTGIHLAGFKPYDGSTKEGHHLPDIVGGNARLGIGAEYTQEKTAEAIDAMAVQSLAIQEAQEKEFKAEQELEKDQVAQVAGIRAKAAEDQLRAADASYRDQRRLQDEALRKTLAQEDQWAQAGNTIGEAFVTSLSQQLQRLMAGEDLDAGEVVANVIGDVLAVAGQVIGTAIGSAYGGAAGAQLGSAIGGAAGGLAGAGVKALGRAGRSKKYHEGGPVGDELDLPRYHSGGYLAPDEVPMIGQKGEYMLSRQHVAAMGGKAGVEQAINNGGRPQFSFVIQTIDGVGTRQFFENDGGRGFYNALRTGRGSLAPAFGGG